MQHRTTSFYRLHLNHFLTINKFMEYLFFQNRHIEYKYTKITIFLYINFTQYEHIFVITSDSEVIPKTLGLLPYTTFRSQ